jgi:hypothetical protein
MVKVDDFAYLLVGAIIIIAVLLAIFALIPPGGIGVQVPVYNFTLGPVGINGENVETISFGSFTVGGTNSDILKSMPQLQITSGYLGGHSERLDVNVLNAYVPLAKQATITFTVYDSTPTYGNLIIKWNGMELYKNGASRGFYTLHADSQNIQELNSLEISADGPGAYFWAYTTYVIRDFKVTLNYGSLKLLPFTLTSSDIEGFKSGALEFSSPGGSGTLTVKLNGGQIFSGTPGQQESAKFDLFNAGINPGNNMITMSTQGDTFQLNDVNLKISLYMQQAANERAFTIPSDKYDLLGQGYLGKIEFDVNNITSSGTMEISLNGNKLDIPALQKGQNYVVFTADQANEGQNTLKFSGTGGWDVGQVRILLER